MVLYKSKRSSKLFKSSKSSESRRNLSKKSSRFDKIKSARIETISIKNENDLKPYIKSYYQFTFLNYTTGKLELYFLY